MLVAPLRGEEVLYYCLSCNNLFVESVILMIFHSVISALIINDDYFIRILSTLASTISNC